MWVITRVFFTALVFLGVANITRATLLYPNVLDVAVKQGDVGQFDIVVQNESAESKTYLIDFIGVELGDEQTDYSFYELSVDEASWFSSELESFDLVSGEVREFVISIAPSETAKSQSMVVGARIVESASDSSGIAVQSGFITLLFVSIGDGILEDSQWLGFDAESTISFSEVDTYYTVRNSGDRFVQPSGSVSLVSWMGGVVNIFDANPEFKRIAEGQERTFAVSVSDPWALGPYQVKVDVQPWADGEVYSDSLVVWFFSLRAMGLIAFVLITLAFIWRYAKRS
ncbi:hypothetical protein HN358_03275 [Candidatus Uhrbacteria bacterium]|jgi:hypothetical protein|nr:hypothetical protein [Candidatus Uhrbacteria bacterium]MBT7717624.1 hypothetical protein [Candidatus Uhrbacteria bacterium]